MAGYEEALENEEAEPEEGVQAQPREVRGLVIGDDVYEVDEVLGVLGTGSGERVRIRWQDGSEGLVRMSELSVDLQPRAKAMRKRRTARSGANAATRETAGARATRERAQRREADAKAQRERERRDARAEVREHPQRAKRDRETASRQEDGADRPDGGRRRVGLN